MVIGIGMDVIVIQKLYSMLHKSKATPTRAQLCLLPFMVWSVYRCTSTFTKTVMNTSQSRDFLFATFHTTPFLYVKIHFCVLQKRSTNVMRFDILWG